MHILGKQVESINDFSMNLYIVYTYRHHVSLIPAQKSIKSLQYLGDSSNLKYDLKKKKSSHLAQAQIKTLCYEVTSIVHQYLVHISPKNIRSYRTFPLFPLL